MEFNIDMDTIHKMMQYDNIKSGDFAQIAMEESAELSQAISKIKRGRCTLTDKDNLIEEMADNILATMYLMESLGLTNEVAETLELKHARNINNAADRNFIGRQKCSKLETVLTLLNNSIKLHGGQKPIIATILDDNYCMVVENHLMYKMVYVQKYAVESSEPELEDMLCGEHFFETVVGSDFNQTVKSVYICYKNAIMF